LKKSRRIFSVLAIVGLLGSALVVSARATEQGIVLDQGTFSGAVPEGYTGSSDLKECEFRRYSEDGMHYQQIYTKRNDTCSRHTTGAPRKGDVSIYRQYSVQEGEYYKAWAVTRTINPFNAVAQVKLIFRDLQLDPPGVGECYGKTDSTSFTTIHTGTSRLKINDRVRPQGSASGGCLVPDGVDEIALHFRVRAREVHAYGKAVLDHLRFGRCADSGDCSNVPAP
jgi:hypothetical protein